VPWTGERLTAQALKIGYFAQHQVEQLRADEVAAVAPRPDRSGAREQELRNFLGGFDFRGEMPGAPVGRFSGGEKARLTLALLVRQRPNLLILDEPTNHLDIEMREAAGRGAGRITTARWSSSRTTGTCCARPPTCCGW